MPPSRRLVLYRSFGVLAFGAVFAFFIYALQPIEGRIGHDYYHEFSRLMAGGVHFWHHPLAIPHYIATLCAGLPWLADPQSSYYSLPQGLAFFVDPLLAAQITAALFLGLGFWGAFTLFRKALGSEPRWAYFGALLFATNGFYFENLFVGHLTYHSYALLPWLLYFILKKKESFLTDAARTTLGLTYLFYSGGFHILVVTIMAFILFLPVIASRFPKNKKARRIEIAFYVAAMAGVLSTCSGRAVAELLYAKLFYTEHLDLSPHGFIASTLRFLWFIPSKTPLTETFGNMNMGIWEFVAFISKLTVIGTLGALGALLFSKKTKSSRASYRAGGIIVAAVIVIAVGSPLNEVLPFFSHYHNPIKILAALIPLLLWASVEWYQKQEKRFSSALAKSTYWIFLVAVVTVEYGYYVNFFVSHRIGVTYRYESAAYQKLKQTGWRQAIQSVTLDLEGDDKASAEGQSNLACYAPELGYHHERVLSSVTTGSPFQIKDGALNFNHPGCFLYGSYFHCAPWQRVPAAEITKLEQFLNGEASAWGVPWWQSLLLYFNFSCVAALAFMATGKTRALLKLSGFTKLSRL